MEPAALRTQLWTNRSLLVLFLACLAFAFVLARPFLSPLVLASFLVSVCHRPYVRLEAMLGNRHLSAALATLSVGLALVLPAALFVTVLVRQLLAGLEAAQDVLGPGGMLGVATGHLPPQLHEAVASYLPLGQAELEGYLGRATRALSDAAPGVLTLSLDLLVKLFVLGLALFYLFLDGRSLVAWLIRLSPLKSTYTHELLREFRRVAEAMLAGTATVSVLQGFAAWLAFTVLGIPNALVWAMTLAFASFVPALGVGLVYVPMCLYLFFGGRHAAAFGLLAYSLGVIVLVMDHLVRPALVRGKLTMHPLVVFVAIFGGVYVLGLVGLLLGPLVAAMLVTVLRIYARDLHLARSEPQPAAR